EPYWQVDPDSTNWTLTADGVTILQESGIKNLKERLLEDYGISLSFGQTINTGDGNERLLQDAGIGTLANFGFLRGEIEFEDIERKWLTGVQDQLQEHPLNWIRSGQYERGCELSAPVPFQCAFSDHG